MIKAVDLILTFLLAFPQIWAPILHGDPIPELAVLDRVQDTTSDFWAKVFFKIPLKSV